MLFESTKFVAICYSNNRKLILQSIVYHGKEFNFSIMEPLDGSSKGGMET